MRRRLFLSGPIGCGKSTLIQNALGPALARAGGFLTRRVTENGRLAGFELVPAAGGAGRRFLDFPEAGAPRRDDAAFTDCAAGLLRAAAKAPFAVLDELGGLELLLPDFHEALTAFLLSGTPCVGVLKAPPAAGALQRRLALPEGYAEAAAALRALLEADPDTTLLETTGRYDTNAEGAVRHWAAEYARGAA